MEWHVEVGTHASMVEAGDNKSVDPSTIMVELEEVQESNARILHTFGSHLVCVFAGATGGIGRSTLLTFVKYLKQPRIYLLARSEERAEEVIKELQEINPDGEYFWIHVDLSLVNMVDVACRRIREREETINVLFMSQGTLDVLSRTSEGMRLMWALSYFTRMRMINNLLPQLRRAEGLRRVVCVMAGSKEDVVDPNDVAGRKIAIRQARGHISSCITFGLEHFAALAPEVSFIHDHPGTVPTKLSRSLPPGMAPFASTFSLASPPKLSLEESGERHVFLLTSARYPAALEESRENARGVSLSAGLRVAVSSTARVAGGVYSLDGMGISAGTATVGKLAKMREQGIPTLLWEWTEAEFQRVERPIPDPPIPKEQPKPEMMQPDDMLFLPRPMPDGKYPVPDPVRATRPPVTTPEPPEPLEQPHPEMVRPDAVMFLPNVLPDGRYPMPERVQPTRPPIPSPEPEPEPEPATTSQGDGDPSSSAEPEAADGEASSKPKKMVFVPAFIHKIHPKAFRPFRSKDRAAQAPATEEDTVPSEQSETVTTGVVAVPEDQVPLVQGAGAQPSQSIPPVSAAPAYQPDTTTSSPRAPATTSLPQQQESTAPSATSNTTNTIPAPAPIPANESASLPTNMSSSHPIAAAATQQPATVSMVAQAPYLTQSEPDTLSSSGPVAVSSGPTSDPSAHVAGAESMPVYMAPVASGPSALQPTVPTTAGHASSSTQAHAMPFVPMTGQSAASAADSAPTAQDIISSYQD